MCRAQRRHKNKKMQTVTGFVRAYFLCTLCTHIDLCRLCMCVLFLDGEFSATALLSETARIKNTYTSFDGIFPAHISQYAFSEFQVK